MAKKQQRETIINWVEGEDTAQMYTCNRKLKNRMEKYGIEPEEEDDLGGQTFEIPVNFVRVQKPAEGREWTDEERAAARERLAESREKRFGKKKKGKKAAEDKASKKPKSRDEDEEEDEDEDEEEEAPKSKAKKNGSVLKTAKSKKVVEEEEDDDEDEDDEEEVVEVVRRKDKKAKAKGKK